MDVSSRVVVVKYDANEQRIGRCLTILSQGLKPFIEKTLKIMHGEKWIVVAHEALKIPLSVSSTTIEHLDVRYVLQLIIKFWNEGLHAVSSLEPFHKNLAFELRQARNEWAHQVKFSIEDTYRTLDNMERFLNAVGAVKESSIISEERKDVAIEMAQQIVREREQQKLQPHTQHISNYPAQPTVSRAHSQHQRRADYSEDMMED